VNGFSMIGPRGSMIPEAGDGLLRVTRHQQHREGGPGGPEALPQIGDGGDRLLAGRRLEDTTAPGCRSGLRAVDALLAVKVRTNQA
jgi:hypothetical protein